MSPQTSSQPLICSDHAPPRQSSDLWFSLFVSGCIFRSGAKLKTEGVPGQIRRPVPTLVLPALTAKELHAFHL